MTITGSNRTWLILAGLAVVVLLAYYLLEVRGVADRPDATVDVVWEIAQEDVVGLAVTDRAFGVTMAVERDAQGDWHMVQPFEELALASVCDQAAYTVASLQVRQTIDDPPAAEMGAYGLLAPAYTVEVQLISGDRLTLEVGARHADGSYYARRSGEESVLVLGGYIVGDVIGLVDQLPIPPTVAPTPGLPLIGPLDSTVEP